MSWRTVQLGNDLCDQDRKILNLFDNQPVRYIGTDIEFAQHLNTSESASNLILIFNRNQWCSDIIDRCSRFLTPEIDQFYIGINRYTVLGNDTNQTIDMSASNGENLIKFLTKTVNHLGFIVTDYGTFDNDLGRYFNFIQPLTWMYGKQK